MKKCSICLVEKSLDGFANHPKTKDLKDIRCRQCMRKKYYAERKEVMRQTVLNNQAVLNKIKIEKGCADCGYNSHPIALDFDHVTGKKEFTISNAISSLKDIKTVLIEVEKCDVVCANCHRIRTSTRGEFLK